MDEEVKASGLSKANPDNLIERPELLILETKTSDNGLYDELFKISKQLLLMRIINQKQLDNFVFNYGKWAKLWLRPLKNETTTTTTNSTNS